MGHTHKTVRGEKSWQHHTAQNSNTFLTGSGISLSFTLPPSKTLLGRSRVWLYLWRGTAWLLIALAVTGAALAVGVGLGAALGLAGAPGATAGMGQASCMCRRHRQAAAGRRSSCVSMLLVFFKVLPWGEPPSEPRSHRLSSMSTPSPAVQTQRKLQRPCHRVATKGAGWVYASQDTLIMVLLTLPSSSPSTEKHFSVKSLSLLAQWLRKLTITLK